MPTVLRLGGVSRVVVEPALWGMRADADSKTIWFAMAHQSPDLTEPLGWSTRLAGR